jgi:hypothetical protein
LLDNIFLPVAREELGHARNSLNCGSRQLA